ncbi:MAG: hypothetical protein KCHDKBKB_00078 [Elusimicrobia bacterium]|nr:hypothetical protein [Elusimicrobiota bacterium]
MALAKKLKNFSVVTVLGPRQCGKTTFVRHSLSDWDYFDLEKTSDRVPFEQDAEARLAQFPSKLILDEAQRFPEIFPLLRGMVDEDPRKKGRFVLLGSASPSLVRHISESLAGRTAFLDMTPFCWDEIKGQSEVGDPKDLWLKGGFPDAFLQKKNDIRWEWFEAYVRTFVERDLPSLGIDISISQMHKLWAMLAHFNGGIWNASQLASSLGVSYHLVNRYTDILEQTFLIRKLVPFFANLRKRIVKSPKVYFRDTGLLHFFLGIRDKKTLDVHPGRGASWESFVIEHVIAGYQLQASGSRPYYWRTATGSEVDLLIEHEGRLIPFEIKLHSAPVENDARGLISCMNDLGLKRGYVLCPAQNRYSIGKGIEVLPVEDFISNPKMLVSL